MTFLSEVKIYRCDTSRFVSTATLNCSCTVCLNTECLW